MAGSAIALKQSFAVLGDQKITGKQEKCSEKKNEGYSEST
jgi:hypothetical protein